MKQKALLLSAVLLIAAFSGCCHGPRKDGESYHKISVWELSNDPGKYDNKNVDTGGLLRNSGENYFRDLRLVLEDGKGSSIAVRPWLPLEVPPARPGMAKRERPRMISDFLNRNIRIKGTWQKEAGKYILVVNEAIIDDKPED